jgi:ATP adenylyltransferase
LDSHGEKLGSDPFHVLSDFLTTKMRMSHIYQPVILKVLLKHDGAATARQIAEAFLAHDESQIEYYEEITKRWPAKVLGGHGLVKRDGQTYRLALDMNLLTDSQRKELIGLCDQSVSAYKEKRGQDIWEHRVAGLGEVSGSVRYEVLKRAGFRCELCGVPADERALDVDHIVPRKYEGTDEPENLQALCWKCNANKGARDSTDFRAVRDGFAIRDKGCPFCEIDTKRVITENGLAYSVRDAYPVSPLHSLVIPKRHVADFFELTGAETNAVVALLKQAKTDIQARDPSVSAFNMGVNNGKDAGQTVFHVHFHVIPRRTGDVENPRGEVRAVVPGKASY